MENHTALNPSLHRFDGAETLDKPAVIPDGFSLSDYIEQGEFSFPLISNKYIQLVIKVESYLMRHLSECRLSTDQTIIVIDDGYQVTANVLDSEQLRWWIRSFGSSVEVLEPKHLREEISKEINKLKKMYS